MSSSKVVRRHRGRWGLGAGVVLVLLIAASLMTAEAYANSLSVVSQPIVHRYGSVVYESTWSAANAKAWTITPNLSGSTVTTVTVSGAKQNNTVVAVRVNLLDGAGAVISTGCVATGKSGSSFSNLTADVAPDVLHSRVARVRAVGATAC